MKRVYASLAMGAAALVVALTAPTADAACPVPASSYFDVSGEFCLRVDPNATESGWTKKDNWAMVKFRYISYYNFNTKQFFWTDIEEIHVVNDGSRGAYKCGAKKNICVGKKNGGGNLFLNVKHGPDSHPTLTSDGPWCFTAERVKHDHIRPWRVKSSTGC